MTAMRRLSVLVPAVLLAAATAAADVVITADEVIHCWDVRPAGSDSVCFMLPRLELRTLSTLDIYEIRLTGPGRVAALSSQLPQVRVVLDSGQPIPAPAARARQMNVTRDSSRSVWSEASIQKVEQDATRFVGVELLSFGPGLSTSHGLGANLKLLHIGVEFSRVRLGLALLDVVEAPFLCLLPVTAGYTIYERPVSYGGSLYARLPEVQVEATAGFINTYIDQLQAAEIPFRGTFELVYSIDGFGLGASVAAGCCYYYDAYMGGESNTALYAAVRLHLVRFRSGF